ncbi:hypothetical protein J532_4387, partial [Acinetobacter baumannii 940793]
MTTIYLVRHGQASFGKSNYDELSENGEAISTAPKANTVRSISR